MRNEAPLRSPREDGETECQQQVFEQLKVSRDGGPARLALPRDFADVERRRVGESSGLQETREAAHIPGQALGPHFLLHIEGSVGRQCRRRVVGGKDGRNGSQREGARQIEPGSELPGHEGMHRPQDRASGQQVRPSAAQLPGAGSGQDEPASGRGRRPRRIGVDRKRQQSQTTSQLRYRRLG